MQKKNKIPKNLKKEENTAKNDINLYEQYYERLLSEIQLYKNKYYKKESNKNFKTLYFSKFIESNGYTLNLSKINLIWLNHTFLSGFLKDLEEYPDYEQPIKNIIKILCGDFNKAQKIHKMQKYLRDYEKEINIYLKQKLASFYYIKLSKYNKHILFSICLQKDNYTEKKTASAYIYFISITQEWNFEDICLNFINNNILIDDNKFPYLEFDKTGFFMNKEILFRNIKEDIKTQICYPLNDISFEKIKIFNTEYINKIKYEYYNDENDFILDEVNESIISQIELEPFEEIIKDTIDGKFWKDIKLSNQEKEKIFHSIPFLISGRPGTGKTTIILVKLFAIYYDFFLKKEKRFEYFKSLNLNNRIKIPNYTSDLRIIFTSFSQDLCKEQNKSFLQMLEKVNAISYKENDTNIIRNEISMDEIYSFRDINLYPAFINFRKIMFMIDGSLTFQFFKRKDLRVLENSNDSMFFYDKNKIYLCNNYYILSDTNFKNNFINFFYRSPTLIKDFPTINLKESNENTFAEFYQNYISGNTPLAKKLIELNINPIEIYSQYISIIKGSYTSHLYPTNAITLDDYKKKGRKITDYLDLETVYDLCMKYEDFKRKSNYFDIQDLTNFLIRQVLIEFSEKNIKLIDYIFIDEIQDLTVSQIFLLILVSRHCKIYAGDTCQTISKINRFRFSELNNIFYNFKKVLPNFETVQEANLNINYRLNSKIMRLSTYMAYFMRECFPNTLDKFKDDFSIKVTNYKPLLIRNINSLFNIFNDENTYLEKNLTLSSLHCFICRDKQTKNQLERRRVMPMTIEESKGLEYDIVIVYNFFSSSKFESLWSKLFRDDYLEDIEGINKDNIYELEKILLNEDLLELVESLGLNQFYENNNEAQIKDRIINELYNMKYPQLKKDFDIHSNFEFCSELKQFYVMITRPRTFLLFSENRIDEEFPFFSRMINNGIIEYINNDSYIDTIMDFYTTNQMIIRNKRQMIFLGNQAFESGHYYNAAYFYSKAGEDLLEKHAKIYYNHNILKDEIKNNKNDLSDDEIKNMSYEILNYIQDLKKSGEQIFFDNENIEAFGQINIGNYGKAIKIYKNKGMFNEVGETYFYKINDYEKAFIYYSLANNISKAIESLETSTEKGHLIRLFDYINKKEIATNLGLSEYFNCYKRNINQLFNLESGKKRIILNEKINDNIIENKIKINKDSTNNKSNDKNTQINSNQEENIIQNIKEEEAQININDNDLKNEKSNKYDNKRKRKKNGKRRRFYQKNKNNIKN